jgi:hypothetical protein
MSAADKQGHPQYHRDESKETADHPYRRSGAGEVERSRRWGHARSPSTLALSATMGLLARVYQMCTTSHHNSPNPLWTVGSVQAGL